MYDTVDYAKQKLVGTVVRLNNGEPIHILDVVNKMLVVFVKNDSDEHTKTTEFKNIDISSPPLGFINTHKGAFFVSRIPKRNDWRQGVRPENCSKVAVSALGGGRLTTNEIMAAIVGPKEQPFWEATKEAESLGGLSVAIHRHWAITNRNIYYKWDKVGSYKTDTAEISFNKDYAYLESRFYEDCQV